MKKLLTLALLLCTTLLSAQNKSITEWQEIDTLIAQGHYTSAYNKSGDMLKAAKRKGDSHSILKAVYKQQIAAAAYQEEYTAKAIKAYQDIVPRLKGADKGMAYMLLANACQHYLNRNRWKIRQNSATDKPAEDIDMWSEEMFERAIRHYHEAALSESKALKVHKVQDYDLLIEGDTLGLRLRPTLYDVVMHAVTDNIAYDSETRAYLYEQRNLLFGTADEFLALALPDSAESHTIWQLKQLQTLTRHHLSTEDAAIRAYIDRKRMEAIRRRFTHTATLSESYVDGLERIAQSYTESPIEEAMFVYLLAQYHHPDIRAYSRKKDMEQGLAKAEKMERYLQRIKEIAPSSEWNKLGEQLYKSATTPYLNLPDHVFMLPNRADSLMLNLRNTENVTYRIVPRHAGEDRYTMNVKEVIGRKSVGRPYYKIQATLPNPYIYKKVKLELPALEAGDYFIIATNDGKDEESKCSSITGISVSNLKMTRVIDHTDHTHLGMVIDATTGRAVTDCEVALMERTSKETLLIERYTPDEKGYFTIPLPDRSTYRNLYLRASDGISYTECGILPDYWSITDTDVLFTFLPDRYTYEPGDTVHFNLMAYTHTEEGSSVLSQRPIKVALRDTKNKEAGTMLGTTDEWGCLSGALAIDKATTPGRFTLQATDTLSGRMMYHTINVESFKAPTFTATIAQPTTSVRFGDSLTLQGTVTTFTEMPVTGAKVRYEVTATDMSLFGYHQSYTRDVSDTTTTDEKGNFYIPFRADDVTEQEESATRNYTIKAHITDAIGETQTVQTNFIVGYRTKRVVFEEKSDFTLHGDSIAYTLRTLTDEPLAEKVHVRLSKLSVPINQPIHASVERDMETWSEENVIIDRTEQTSITGRNSICIASDMPCGVYRLTVSYDDGGKQYSETCHFTLWDEGKSKVSSYALYVTGHRADKVATGDTAVLYIGTRHSDVYIHYYIRVEGHVMDKGTLQLTDEVTTLRVPIKNTWRGYMSVELAAVKENVPLAKATTFSITNQSELLQMHLSSFRDYLQPGETEQCTLSIKDYLGRPVEAAFTLSVYNAALDSYGHNNWDIALAPTKSSRKIEIAREYYTAWAKNPEISKPHLSVPRYYDLPEVFDEGQVFYSLAAPATTRGQAKNRAGFDMASAEGLVLEESAVSSEASKTSEDSETSEPKTQEPYLRKDLRHTALFLPTLRTDEQGQATFTLTAPDLLTRWHVKGIAHTKDLKHGRVNFDFVTRKTLMVQPHVPRFLYEGDQCEFTAKVTNSGDEPIEAVVRLETGGREQSQSVSIAPNSSTSVSFPIIAPTGENYQTYRITAESLRYSDGEQATITVLPRRTLVTETMALYVNGKEKREFVFDALKEKHSPTLVHKSLTLELVPNPIWYAIEALPPLCKEENPSNERLFHRYYAATMGAYLIDRYPEVEGYSEFYRRDSLAALCQSLLSRLATNQDTDGGWAWMNGFDSDRYTTLLIIKGLGELEAMHSLNIAQNDTLYTLVKHGIHFLDANYYDSFSRMKRKPKTLDSYALYYLYARSMFPEIPFGNTPSTAYEHYKALLMKDKATQGTLMQKALKMLTLIRLNERNKATAIAEVVRQSSLKSDEMGIYWRDNRYGWSWDSNPIATQAMLIEAFKRLDQPADIIGRMQQWLLKQKQTTQWSNSVATAQAVYALMEASPLPLPRRGDTDNPENVKVKVKNATLRLIEKDKRGTVKYEVTPEKRVSAMPEIPIILQSQRENTISWGSMTWQYYEDADKVQASGTGLTLKCTYYKVEIRDGKEILTALPESSLSLGEGGGRGPAKGDRVRVRLHFTADRAMDYVELHLQRPAALEPVSTRSGYTYSNGLGYYRSIENSATKLYFYRIGKGNYFIDGDFWVSQSGEYTSAPSTIQCMYAPEFVATAPAQWIKIK